MLEGTVTLGMLVAFIQYSQRFFRPIQDLSEKYNILQSAMAACERIFKLLDTAPEIVSPADPVKPQGQVASNSRMSGSPIVACPTSQRSREQDREATPPNRQRISTNADWILQRRQLHHRAGRDHRHRRPHRRRQDHHHLSDDALLRCAEGRSQDRWRRSARDGPRTICAAASASCLQDPFLFTGTIAENIRLGNRMRSTTQAMRKAAGRSQRRRLHRFASRWIQQNPYANAATRSPPDRSSSINFARALAHNPHILILDEATSSVDTETEFRVRDALDAHGRRPHHRDHRASSLHDSARRHILVMHKAKLREMGTHQQLLAKRGIYWKLYQLQYKDQELGIPSTETASSPQINAD